MNDQYFTPENLAQSVIASVSVRRVQLIADFAAGHGGLLAVAATKWPAANVLACDIDRKCVEHLRATRSAWTSLECDFLNTKSRFISDHLRSATGKCDLIILNPPFSGRGCAVTSIKVGDKELKASRAMAFIVAAVNYLRVGGEICAILPASCMTSDKDQPSRDYCAMECESEVVQAFSKMAFAGCVANTVLIKLRRRRTCLVKCERKSVVPRPNVERQVAATLIRGCLPVYRAENGLAGTAFPFFHSTDLQFEYAVTARRSVDVAGRVVTGPAVLVTRVGSPATRKCALYVENEPIVLSDCVIAIKCANKNDAIEIRRRLLARWHEFSSIYGGTCAPYTTIERMKQFLLECGVAT